MAPDKIYIQPRTIDKLPRQNIVYTKQLSDSSIEYIRKDTLMEYLQKAYDTDKWFYNTHKKPNEVHFGRCEAYRKVIEKIESL